MQRPSEIPASRAEVIRFGSLCTADCEEGYHVPDFVKCQRCGAHIHARVIEVADPERGLITVGSECIKPIMGWKWSKSHESALGIQDDFDRALVEQGTLVTEIRKSGATLLINEHLRDTLRIGKGSTIPVAGWVDRIWRAAEDLGLPWQLGSRFESTVIATRQASLDSRVFNWTAKLPGGPALGGQETEWYVAKSALRSALEQLFVPRHEYHPRGGIWEGADKLVHLATWRSFMGYDELPLNHIFA